jgi:CDP-diacylglycerol--serine O-phosphatidyltransferase
VSALTKKWIPNLFTVINLFAGLVAILLSLAERWMIAAVLILGAALFDSVDGRIARRLNATTEFGKELDSLADLVSFGVAPATMMYLLNFTEGGWSGCILTVVFPICGALRLYRFNISEVKSYYVGMPLTLAGSFLVGSALLGKVLPFTAQAFILLVLSTLMVSTIKIPKI